MEDIISDIDGSSSRSLPSRRNLPANTRRMNPMETADLRIVLFLKPEVIPAMRVPATVAASMGMRGRTKDMSVQRTAPKISIPPQTSATAIPGRDSPRYQ